MLSEDDLKIQEDAIAFAKKHRKQICRDHEQGDLSNRGFASFCIYEWLSWRW